VRLLAVLVTVLAAGAIVPAFASGSFSAKLDTTGLEVNVEQTVWADGPWVVYAGSGFAASWGAVEKIQPYTLACHELDVGLAFAETCFEVRLPLVGEGEWMRAFFTVAW
jgi:hypothetical protein